MKTLELPFEIERNNPVPEVRHWDNDDITFYYFNWGLKNSGGYNLNFESLNNNLITVKALVPAKSNLSIQILTFPHLLISLPQGQYSYRVVEPSGKPIENFFICEHPPLKFSIFLPYCGSIKARVVLRDPYAQNVGKTTAQIALDALFSQDEMLEFINRNVLPDRATFCVKDKKWFILMSKSFDCLETREKRLMIELITRTFLALEVKKSDRIEIVTDPAKISENV